MTPKQICEYNRQCKIKKLERERVAIVEDLKKSFTWDKPDEKFC